EIHEQPVHRWLVTVAGSAATGGACAQVAEALAISSAGATVEGDAGGWSFVQNECAGVWKYAEFEIAPVGEFRMATVRVPATPTAACGDGSQLRLLQGYVGLARVSARHARPFVDQADALVRPVADAAVAEAEDRRRAYRGVGAGDLVWQDAATGEAVTCAVQVAVVVARDAGASSWAVSMRAIPTEQRPSTTLDPACEEALHAGRDRWTTATGGGSPEEGWGASVACAATLRPAEATVLLFPEGGGAYTLHAFGKTYEEGAAFVAQVGNPCARPLTHFDVRAFGLVLAALAE
ncbi:MAG TPA: hypothetical protein VHH36_07430, partial [Candidatus Thermoplasmatota archaeon]|nr:hypothetical protein [Candidatus Thermoplasmatota archaeon]